tara:strand:+ start:85 stop:246 length:162 start_codon:yes stop_codon:yes gene_type:complete
MPDWTRHLLFALAMAVLVVGGTVAASQLLLPLADAPEVATSPVLSFVTLVFGA